MTELYFMEEEAALNRCVFGTGRQEMNQCFNLEQNMLSSMINADVRAPCSINFINNNNTDTCAGSHTNACMCTHPMSLKTSK